MLTIYFDNIDNLITFLNDTKEFNEWEAIIFRISAVNGMELNINTQINDTLGIREFIEFKKLKPMLSNFLLQNSFLSINIEIKLRFPKILKQSIDPSNNYQAFYIDFFSDQISSTMAISFMENVKEINDKPAKAWITYITNLYDTWIIQKNRQ